MKGSKANKRQDLINRDLARASKVMALLCFRNTFLEGFHEGTTPVSNTGDYSDVKVVDANGREIPWQELSRIRQDEMKRLMIQITDRIYTFLKLGEDEHFQAFANQYEAATHTWEVPKLDGTILAILEQYRKLAESKEASAI